MNKLEKELTKELEGLRRLIVLVEENYFDICEYCIESHGVGDACEECNESYSNFKERKR